MVLSSRLIESQLLTTSQLVPNWLANLRRKFRASQFLAWQGRQGRQDRRQLRQTTTTQKKVEIVKRPRPVEVSRPLMTLPPNAHSNNVTFQYLPSVPLFTVARRHRTSTTTTTASTTTLSANDLKALCQGILKDADVMTDQFFGNPEDCTSFYQCSL